MHMKNMYLVVYGHQCPLLTISLFGMDTWLLTNITLSVYNNSCLVYKYGLIHFLFDSF